MEFDGFDRLELIDLLVLGGPVELLQGTVVRSVLLPSETIARGVYGRLAVQAEGSARMRLARDGATVTLTIAVDPAVYRLFETAGR
ncbi:MAG: hypothetical protein MJE77_36490 [Proteobacteria bacterium]|nr:hypothetical protein [Pseudomonadota bacterium]